MHKVTNPSRIKGVVLLLSMLLCSQLCKKKSGSPSEIIENTGRSKPRVIPAVSDSAKDELTSDTMLDNLGKPRGLPNLQRANLCYINSTCQLLAACFPKEMEQPGRNTPDSLQDRLRTVIRYINEIQTSSDVSDNNDRILEHVQYISEEINLHNEQYGGSISDFLSELNKNSGFLSDKKLLHRHKISYTYEKQNFKEEIEDTQGNCMALFWPAYTEHNKMMARCFRNRYLFYPYMEYYDGEDSDNHNNHYLVAWKQTLSELDWVNLSNEQSPTDLSHYIVDRYLKNLASENTEELNSVQENTTLEIPCYYLKRVDQLPKGAKIVIDNSMFKAIPKEYIDLSYGNEGNPQSQRFELIGKELMVLEDDDKNTQTGWRKHTADLIVYQALQQKIACILLPAFTSVKLM